MVKENRFVSELSRHYEEFSKAVSPPLIKGRLNGYRMAIIVTGTGDTCGDG